MEKQATYDLCYDILCTYNSVHRQALPELFYIDYLASVPTTQGGAVRRPHFNRERCNCDRPSPASNFRVVVSRCLQYLKHVRFMSNKLNGAKFLAIFSFFFTTFGKLVFFSIGKLWCE